MNPIRNIFPILQKTWMPILLLSTICSLNNAYGKMIKGADGVWREQVQNTSPAQDADKKTWSLIKEKNLEFTSGTKSYDFSSEETCLNMLKNLEYKAKNTNGYQMCKNGFTDDKEPNLTCLGDGWGTHAQCIKKTLYISF